MWTALPADIRPFNIVALFCGVGLVASFCLAALGGDVSGELSDARGPTEPMPPVGVP
jgi:hypothetical protein